MSARFVIDNNGPSPDAWAALGPRMPDGIYFGLDEKEYRRAGAASSSLLKSLAVSPLTAWAEHIDPDREDESTEAQDLGTALHKRILEGDEVFRQHFAVKPENDGEYCEGQAELKERCKELGLKVGGSIAELCARIRAADPDAKLWPDVIAAWKAENGGKIALKPDEWRRLELRARLVLLHPYCKNAFQGGYPEVSIFWTHEDGTPLKSRVDYLKADVAVDLKYFANKAKLPVDQAVGRAIANETHTLQARIYLDGIAAAREHVRAGRVFGEPPPREWLDAFTRGKAHRFFWCFVQKGNVPEVRVREFAQYITGASGRATENAYFTDATLRFENGRQILQQCLVAYGPDPSTPWIVEQPARALTDEDLPMYALA